MLVCTFLHLFHFIIVFKDMHTNSFWFFVTPKQRKRVKKKMKLKKICINVEVLSFFFAYTNFWNSKYSKNRITCGTIISRQICGAFTPPVRLSTCFTFTVCWTFPCTVCAKISFYTSYGINEQRNCKW